MSDSVKQKRPNQCPFFIGVFSFHRQDSSTVNNCHEPKVASPSREVTIASGDLNW
jgi:hypothetical protein